MSTAFPSIQTMSRLGMTGYKGVNPLRVLEHPDEPVPKPSSTYFECDTCGFYSLTRTCVCIRDDDSY